MNTAVRPQLIDVRIRILPDDNGDISDLGEYHDGRKGIDEWDICRRTGEFVHDMRAEAKAEFLADPANRKEWQEYYADDYDSFEDYAEDYWEDDFEIPRCDREYSFFRPYAAGEKAGTEDFQKYGKQDYKRAEDYGNGWNYVGVRAEATIEVNDREQTIRSAGCWGIESDSGPDYLAEVAREEFAQLRADLIALGIPEVEIEDEKPDFTNIE